MSFIRFDLSWLSPPDVEWTEQGLAIRFLRPSAVVLRREGERKLT